MQAGLAPKCVSRLSKGDRDVQTLNALTPGAIFREEQRFAQTNLSDDGPLSTPNSTRAHRNDIAQREN